MASINTSATTIINSQPATKKLAVLIGEEKRHSLDSSLLTLYNKNNDSLDTSKKTKIELFLRQAQEFKTRHREFLAEFIGTTILVLLTCGFCAEQTLNIEQNKSWLTSSFGSGLSVLVGICVAGHVSGAHLNPAITISFCLFSGFPARKVPVYVTAQLTGSFTGAALLYSIIKPAIVQFDQGERQILGPQATAGIFGTYPPLYVGIGSAIASEIVGTAMLLLIVMVTGHPNNLPFRTAQGAMIALGVTTISLCIGYTSGFSLNPARDFGPRLFTAVAGWGLDVFKVHNYYALVPMFAPILGGVLGAFVYTVFID
ncbi:aquaporin-like protein [Sporodiniella umbellata]|nr:aquaporin-like protein [Sporodiniella umbellata]